MMRKRGSKMPRYGKLLDVLPCFAADYSPNAIPTNFWVVCGNLGNSLMGRKPATDFQHILLGKFSESRIAPPLGGGYDEFPSASRIPISHVVSLGSCIKMVRVYADRVVAMMQREQVSQWPFVSFVRHTVSGDRLKIFGRDAVAVAIEGTLPFPAFIDPIWWGLGKKVANATAKLLDAPDAIKHAPTIFAWFGFPISHEQDCAPTRVRRQGGVA